MPRESCTTFPRLRVQGGPLCTPSCMFPTTWDAGSGWAFQPSCPGETKSGAGEQRSSRLLQAPSWETLRSLCPSCPPGKSASSLKACVQREGGTYPCVQALFSSVSRDRRGGRSCDDDALARQARPCPVWAGAGPRLCSWLD